jgi:hypothetical protein
MSPFGRMGRANHEQWRTVKKKKKKQANAGSAN